MSAITESAPDNGLPDTIATGSGIRHEDVTVAVILPLGREVAGALQMFADPDELQPGPGDGALWLCRVPSVNAGDPPHVVALAQPTQTGNTHAAICVTRLLDLFESLEAVVLCGIAGGVPQPKKSDRDLHLGDVVLLNENGILQYDFGHLHAGRSEKPPQSESRFRKGLRALGLCRCSELDPVDRFEAKGDTLPPDPTFLAIRNRIRVRDELGDAPWRTRLSSRLPTLVRMNPLFARPPQTKSYQYDTLVDGRIVPVERTPPRDEPKFFEGGIGSANCVLKSVQRRDQLRDRTPSIIAVDMEAAGVAQACAERRLAFTVVRGICDFCDGNKNDDWQYYAAAAAAALAYHVVEQIPPAEERSKVRRVKGVAQAESVVAQKYGNPQSFARRESASSLIAIETPVRRETVTELIAEVESQESGPTKSAVTPEQSAIKLLLSDMLAATSQHDWPRAVRIAEEAERRLDAERDALPSSLVVEGLCRVATTYTSWSGACTGDERTRWRERARNLVSRARGLQG